MTVETMLQTLESNRRMNERAHEQVYELMDFYEELRKVEPRLEWNHSSGWFMYKSGAWNGSVALTFQDVRTFREAEPLFLMLDALGLSIAETFEYIENDGRAKKYVWPNLRNFHFTLNIRLAEDGTCELRPTGRMITRTQLVEVKVPEMIAVCPEENE